MFSIILVGFLFSSTMLIGDNSKLKNGDNSTKVKTSAILGSTTVSNYAGGGYVFGEGNTWLGENNASGAPDNSGARSLVFANNASAFLLVKEFGFNIPCNAEIESVTFNITRRNSANIATTVNAIDSTISVFNPLTLSVSSFNAADPSVWVQDGVSYETVSYTDADWGVNMTPELINNERFGLVIEAKHGSLAGRIEATVDAVEMVVCYNLTDPPVSAISFEVEKEEACFDEGVITINPSGGTGNYEYTINTGAEWFDTNVFSGLSVGTYLVGVRNANMTCQTEFRFVNLSGDERILQPGDAVVACATTPASRVTLAIEKMQPAFDLFNQGEVGYDISPFIAYHPYEWTFEQLGGEVFSTAIDQERNIYTVTTSLYDITPGASVPTIVSRISSVDAQVTQIATLPGSVGAAGIDYDSICNKLFVANLDNGIIYLMDPQTGNIDDTFDPINPDDGAASFAPLGERVMAVAKNHVDGRIYYSMWNSDFNATGIRNTIRSIAIDPNTCMFLDATDREEFELPWTSEYGDLLNPLDFSMPIGDIEFSTDGLTMIMGETGFDSDGPISKPHNSRALRYVFTAGTWVLQTAIPPGNTVLQLELGEFSDGINARGGVAFANAGYDSDLCAIDNDQFILVTSDALRGADCNSIGCFYGLQYLPVTGGNAVGSVLLDIGRDADTQQKGVFGDVDVLRGCLNGIYCCPDLSTNEPDFAICPDAPVSDLVFDTQADSVALVYHTTIPSDSVAVYTNGIPLDTVAAVGGQVSLSLDNLPVGTPGIYYVYGIVHPTPSLDICRPYDSLIVNVRTLPTVTLNDPADQCVDGTDMIFSGFPIPGLLSTGVFTSTAGAGLTDNGNGTAILDLDVATPGMYTVTYTFTDDFGCVNSTSTDVEIFDIPTVSISDPDDVCVDGADLNFVGNPLPIGAATGVFTTNAPGGFRDNGNGTASIDVDVASPGTYDVTYTYTDAIGCDNFSTTSVTINPLPVATINDPADHCLANGTIDFIGTPTPGLADVGAFTTTALAGLTDNGDGTASLDPLVATPGTYDVTYTFTDEFGCMDAAVTSFIVYDTLPNVVFAEGNICGNPTFGTNSIDLNSLITTGPSTGVWTDVNGVGGLIGSTFTANTSLEGGSYQFEYTLTGPGPIGTDCQERVFTATVNVVYCNLDVAMIKTTNQTTPIALNDVVTFEYTICNQGFTNVDSIEITDYLGDCYSFADNNGWVSSGSNAVNTLTVLNGRLPSGGLPTAASAPDDCITIALNLTVICGDPDDLISYAELTGHRDVAGNEDDLDSTPGSDSADERSVLPGGPSDDSFIDVNEDDHDPGVMPVVDVALITTIDMSGVNTYGQAVDFNVQVFNQGNVDLANVDITDYIPCGYAYDLANNPLWSEIGGNAVTTIPSLDAGESVDIPLSLILVERSPACAFDEAWLNETEVSALFDDALNNVSLQDFDSRSNNILGDDAGGAPNTPSDNSIIGDGTGAVGATLADTDEDDHDPSLMDIYDLALDKLVTSTGPYGQDSTVTYQIEVVNQGNVVASNIEISDTPQLGLNFVSSDAGSNPNVTQTGTGIWRIGSLAPDAVEVINATFIVTNNFQGLVLTNSVAITEDDGNDADSSPDLDNTQDDNGDGDPDDDDEDSADIDLVQFYDLSLVKTEVSVGPYEQGDQIVYDITVVNEGTLNAANIQFMDMPGMGLEFVSDNSSIVSNISNVSPMVYEIGTLNFGDSETLRLTFRVNDLFQDVTIMNSGQIIQDDGNDRDSDPDFGPDVDEDGDMDPDDDDEDFIILDVLQTYDLALDKSVISSGPYVPGSTISYNIQISNEGTLNANNIEFVETPSAGLMFVNDDSGSNPNVSLVSAGLYRINTLAFGDSESITLVYQIDPDYQGFDIGNAAEITVDDGDDQDSDPDSGSDVDDNNDGDLDDDDEDETLTDVIQIYDLSIEKELLNVNPIFPGDDVTFLITISNTGTLDATDIEITETPAAEMVFVSSNVASNANITDITNEVYTIADLPHGTTESFEVTYNIPIDYLIPSIDNNVEITEDDGDDQDSDPETSFDVDEDGNGDPYDDDEALLTVPVIIGYNLGDFVWHDLDGDGIQDNNEPGIEGLFVRLYNSLGFLVDVAVTDASGFYLFEEVFPGNYFIGVDLVDDYISTLPNQGSNDNIDNDLNDENGEGTTSVFNLGDDDLTIDLGLVQCAQIGELVWFDYNENDIEDITENGINGMKVELYRFEPLGWTLTDFQYTGHKPGTPSDDGYYKFCVRPGRYYLRFLNPPQSLVLARPNRGNDELDSDVTNRFGPGTTDEINVLSGDELCNISAGYYPMGTISDYIWMDENQNGMRESGEQGIEGVIVRAMNIEGIEVQSTVSQSDGSYVLDYLPKDSYYLEVVPPSGMVASVSNAGTNETLDSDIDGSNGANTTSLFQVNPGDFIDDISIGLVFGVLPVDWLDFWGQQQERFNYLEWTVTSERSVSHYNVERKAFGSKDWINIGRVDYSDQLVAEKVYTYEDYTFDKSLDYNLYRIVQTDFNGINNHSKIITIRTEDNIKSKNRMSIYPNPAINMINLNLELSELSNFAEAKIYNQSGQLLRKIKLSDDNLNSGVYNFELNTSEFLTGIYTIKVELESGYLVEKLVILK